MKIYNNIAQKSDEWIELRKKYPFTSTKATSIVTAERGLETVCWEYMANNLSERVGGRKFKGNIDTEEGNEFEDKALVIYEMETGNKVESIGFVTNKKISNYVGVSPDGFVGKDGMCEVKCFDDEKYLRLLAEYKSTGEITIDRNHYNQMQIQMLVCKRKWNDYIVFNPFFKENIIIQRVKPNEYTFEKIKIGLSVGEAIIKKIEKKLCLKK